LNDSENPKYQNKKQDEDKKVEQLWRHLTNQNKIFMKIHKKNKETEMIKTEEYVDKNLKLISSEFKYSFNFSDKMMKKSTRYGISTDIFG
jgi:hypothetical protein